MQSDNVKKILFVCTGNTCRSPMAEAFMNSAFAAEPVLKESFLAVSAGISAYPGDRASAHSVNVMLMEWNIDVSGHSAALLDEATIEDAFLVLAMTHSQKNYILAEYPGASGKTFTLKEFVRMRQQGNMYGSHSAPDITDPFGKPVHIYSLCAIEIKEAVDNLLEILKWGKGT